MWNVGIKGIHKIANRWSEEVFVVVAQPSMDIASMDIPDTSLEFVVTCSKFAIQTKLIEKQEENEVESLLVNTLRSINLLWDQFPRVKISN